jgi:hypothetical protein
MPSYSVDDGTDNTLDNIIRFSVKPWHEVDNRNSSC